MVFCYYCCTAIRLDNLKRHCRDMHNDVARPLEVGETPLQSIYDDWKTYLEDKGPKGGCEAEEGWGHQTRVRDLVVTPDRICKKYARYCLLCCKIGFSIDT